MSRVAVHERRRRNGWSLPINPLQVVSWVVIILLNLFTLIISLPLPGHPTVPLIFAIAFVWITFCILYGNSVVPVAFDRSLHSHVIEKNFCNICQINVQKGTKHCRALLPNQYQASCPDGCQCERTSFQCRDLGETSTELFRHAMPKIFPELRRADLIRSLFDSDHDFNDLAEVLLGSNSLEHIHSDTFCRVKSLTRLILRDNSLTSFEFDRNCFRSLSLLDLRNNRIYSLPSTLWKRLPLLNSLDVSRNPLHCDCNLQEFHQFARDDVNAFLAQQETTCASPRSVRGRTIFEIEQNFCRGRSGFFDWLLFFVIIGAAFGAYRFFRSGRGAGRLRLPFVTKYTQLKETNDETQPAFV
ncbi:LRRCT domain-containing protein [Aphelenchoides besseyi]|nr:LRRCT domain-containing protein [Aphelenchoides besseyi]